MYDDDANPGTPCVNCRAGGFTSDPLRCVDKCPTGTYAPAGSATDADCRSCSPGTFDHDFDAATDCIICGAGNFTSNPLRCDDMCPEGTFGPPNSKTIADCVPCSPGSYDHDANPSTTCEPCPASMYQDQTGAVTCTACSSELVSLSGSPSIDSCCGVGTHMTAMGASFWCVG